MILAQPRMMSTGIRGYTAAVAKPLSEAMRTKWDFKSIAFTVAAVAVGFAGGFGLAGSHVIERWRSAHQANTKKKELANYFRNQVAATLGIDPRHVTADKLEAAARVNPTIAAAITKVDREQASANRGSLMGNGAALAAGGLLPGISGISKMAIDGGAIMAGGMASSMLDKDVLEMIDVTAMIDEKKRAGQEISEHDLLLLKISQNEKWQKAFKQAHGYAFHKGTPEQQRGIMNNMPELANFTDIKNRANSGLVEVADLPSMVAANDNPRRWTNQVDTQRAAAMQSTGKGA